MDGKVIVLLRTSSVARAPVYRHLRALGTVLVLVHPLLPIPDFNGIFQYWLQHDTNDVAALRTALTDFLALNHLTPDAIVSFDEYAVFQAATLAVHFGRTPIPLPPAAVQENNLKHCFRCFCAAHGISSPKSVRLSLPQLPSPQRMLADAAEAGALDRVFTQLRPSLAASIAGTLQTASIDFPVVLKPSPGAGSLLARLCTTLEEATSHAWCTWCTLANHPDTKHFNTLTDGEAAVPGMTSVQVLAEEYIEGQEVDMDCVVEVGVVRFCSIADNYAPMAPYFAEVGGLCPSTLGLEAQEALRDLLECYVRACGPQLHGVLHFEAKYDEKRRRAYVIEVNLRPGSAETDAMLTTVYREMSLGESLVRCALHQSVTEQLFRLFPDVFRTSTALTSRDRSRENKSNCIETETADSTVAVQAPMWRALGGPARGFFPPQCWAASVNLYPVQAGVLRKVKAPTETASLVAYSVSAVPGETVAPPPARFYLLCWMVARGKTAAEAKYNIDSLTAAFVQEVEPPAST